MASEAKKAGNARHVAKLDLIKIQPYKEEGAAIRAAAAAAGKSVQGYVLEAVREKMGRNTVTPSEQPQEEPQKRRTLPPGWDDDVPAEAIRRAVGQRQEEEPPEIGSAEYWARFRQEEPEEAAQETVDGAGVVTISGSGESNICSSSCSLFHTAPIPPDPEQLSDDEWAAWAVMGEDEPIEDWRKRIGASLPRTSSRDVMMRLGLLPEDVRELYLRNDAQSREERQRETQKKFKRYKELLAKQASLPWPLGSDETVN